MNDAIYSVEYDDGQLQLKYIAGVEQDETSEEGE